MDEKLAKLMKDGWSYRKSGANYVPTDEDLQKIAGMINSGVAQDGVLLTDKKTGNTYDIYVKDGKLMMEESED